MAQDIGNSNLLEVWASSGAAVEPDISKIEEGWKLGEQPPHEFMNWLQNTFGEKLNHVLSNGTPQWNSATSYGTGSTVQRTGSVWIAMQPNANSEPAAGNTNWSRLLKIADASSEAEADKLVLRDANGTAKFSAPTSPEHPTRLGDANAEALPETLVLRDANGTAKFSSPTSPEHPVLSGNVNAVLTAQTIAEQINELTEPDNAGIKSALNATGAAPIYACRAWVNFNGTGTVAIRASGNVSSITDNGVGNYTVNFATAMVDANYSVVNGSGDTGDTNKIGSISPNTINASYFSGTFLTIQGDILDRNYVMVAFFR